MPSFVAPDRVSFHILDGLPSISLTGDIAVGSVEGWSVLNRLTVIVVDGPGDEGLLIKRLDPDGSDLAPAGWDEAVVASGGIGVYLADSGVDFVAHSLN